MARNTSGTEEVGADQSGEGIDEVVFVVMERDPDLYDAPHSANVHPDEVKNYYSGGWLEKKVEAE